MNLMREKLLAVMDVAERGEIAVLVIAHNGRLARFGCDYLEHVAEKNSEKVLKDELGVAGEDHSCRVLGGPERGQG